MSVVIFNWADVADGAELHWLQVQGPIPTEMWARDHTSTLLYAETCAVDNAGRLDDRRMRQDVRYPTRLVRGITVSGHTDYDCLRDAAALDYVKLMEDSGIVRFTDAGFRYVHDLRVKRARRAA